ncbi:MAG: response regulator transcription factor [Syntrophorhabdaceae bacterium]|nr:response regulator transcription factor [Syntrophorhabdaceae bacterium]
MISNDPKPEIRTVIVDDERLARKNLKDLLRVHPYVHVIGEAAAAAEARDVIAKTRPDLVFLDVHMPEGSGFDVLDKLKERPSIIFVTAYDEFAVSAFTRNALDYLLKPLDPGRLNLSLERFLSTPRDRGQPSLITRNDRICLNAGEKVFFIELMDIAAIMSERNYIRIFNVNGECFVLRSPLKEWKERFPSDIFMFLDRSLMINRHHVRLLKKKNRNGEVYVESIETPFHLGRIALQRFKELMGVGDKQGV